MDKQFKRPDFFIPDSFRLNEDPEIWKPVPGYRLYEVSNLGRCRSKAQGKYLIPYKYPRGYQTYSMKPDKGACRYVYVHRLVALAFHDNPLVLKVVNHIDGNKENNLPDNLEWCSYSHNAKHAIRTGLNWMPATNEENNSNAILDRNKVVEILKIHIVCEISTKRIAEMYGVEKSTIGYIIKGKLWPEVHNLFYSQLSNGNKKRFKRYFIVKDGN